MTRIQSNTRQHGWRLPSGFSARVPLFIGGVTLGAALLISAFVGGGLEHFLHTYLVSVCFVVSVSLGALFFVILQHLTRAQWSVTVRRVAEVMAAALPWLLMLFVPLLLLLIFGDSRLYSWNDPSLREVDPLVAGKAAYLNAPFFVLRTLVYFAVWAILARYFWTRSVQQDETGDAKLTLQMQKWSGPAMMAFAVTVCFAAFDWLMSLDPHWFSTIYGVYFFSGAAVGFFAFVTLVALLLERVGALRGALTVDHYHDLGKLLFGFLFFWAYIAFSQYLLLWYANIPEETGWYLVRQSGGWQWGSLLLIFGHLLPFCGLMSRAAKRNRRVLALWAGWLLLMHWVDLYWLVMPSFSPDGLPLGIMDALALIGVGSLYLSLLIYIARRGSLVPTGDPRLSQSLAFHNV